MKAVMRKELCSKCKNGIVYNPMLKKTNKCGTCGGTGQVDAPAGYERDDDCPYNCQGCTVADECKNYCIVFPAFSNTSRESALNCILTADMATLTIERLKYPDNEIRLDNSGQLEVIFSGEKPEPKDPGRVDAGLYLTCCGIIGRAFRHVLQR